MALMYYPAESALVRLPLPHAALPLDLRILEAASALEAAEVVWRMRAREFDAHPSAVARERAEWAAADVRDAADALEALRAEVSR